MTLPFDLSFLRWKWTMFRDAPIDNLNLQPKIKHKMMFSLCSLWTTCHNFISDILWQICREQNVCKSAINSASLIWWQENNVSRARACKWVTKYRFIKRKKNEKEKSALRDNSIRVKVRSKWIVTRIDVRESMKIATFEVSNADKISTGD